MTPATGAGGFGHDPEAPEADAFEQSAAVGDEDEAEDEGAQAGGRTAPLPERDVEAPEADALEQSEPAPLDDDDRR
ncbi:MAG: hypothetical protein KY452_00550 [Actinobacteria bacterium]|nr:hypothetical protein [Actinomycetota bacterium]